ncbi:Gfo/Idh/MocA family protein [Kitasatospora sp. NPDC004240]
MTAAVQGDGQVLKAAVIGFGVAGQARLGAYAPLTGVDLVAVVDPSPARREQAVAMDPALRAYAGLEELLATEYVDLVDVCTPPAYHRDLSLQAMAAGVHVICEKPVAFATADALALTEASRRTGRLLYPAHNYGFSPMMRVLTEAAREIVGSPSALRIEIERSTHAVGTGSWQPDWRKDPGVAGGGILLDHGSHCVYMSTRLFQGLPEKVTATAGWGEHAGGRGVDESIDVRLSFPTGEAEISLSWTGGARRNRYALSGPSGSAEITEGTAVISGPAGREVRELEDPTRSGTHEEWFAELFADFAGLLAHPDRWRRPLGEVESTARIIEAAYRSARADGRPVTLAAG